MDWCEVLVNGDNEVKTITVQVSVSIQWYPHNIQRMLNIEYSKISATHYSFKILKKDWTCKKHFIWFIWYSIFTRFLGIPRWLLLYHQTHRSRTPLDRKPCCIERWSRCGPWRWHAMTVRVWWKMMVHEDIFIKFIGLDISHTDEYYSHRFTSQLLIFFFLLGSDWQVTCGAVGRLCRRENFWRVWD